MSNEILAQPRRELSEDERLFVNRSVRLNACLTPDMSQRVNGDVVVRAVLSSGHSVNVIVSGRRRSAFVGLRAALIGLLGDRIRDANRRRAPRPAINDVRLPTTIEGSWRTVFRRDENGWEERSYEFVAARWTFVTPDGEVETHGKLPLCEVPAQVRTFARAG